VIQLDDSAYRLVAVVAAAQQTSRFGRDRSVCWWKLLVLQRAPRTRRRKGYIYNISDGTVDTGEFLRASCLLSDRYIEREAS
jgi:hypothetical protein